MSYVLILRCCQKPVQITDTNLFLIVIKKVGLMMFMSFINSNSDEIWIFRLRFTLSDTEVTISDDLGDEEKERRLL